MTGDRLDHFAVIADVHGNVDALDAVLADIARRGIGRIVNLGDHVSGPLAAGEAAARLMALDAVTIRGNHDRWVVGLAPETMGPSDRAARDQLTGAQLDWLAALPTTLTLPGGVFLCHGTPSSDLTYWLETVDASGAVRRRPRREIEAEAEGLDVSLILCVHTHVPRRVDIAGGRTILNPGSVGCPGYTDDAPVPHVMETGTPAASYAVAERTGAGWASSFHYVPYDPTRMVAMAKAAARPEWARAVGAGWIE